MCHAQYRAALHELAGRPTETSAQQHLCDHNQDDDDFALRQLYDDNVLDVCVCVPAVEEGRDHFSSSPEVEGERKGRREAAGSRSMETVELAMGWPRAEDINNARRQPLQHSALFVFSPVFLASALFQVVDNMANT